jgi:inorganic pyrophosphatase
MTVNALIEIIRGSRNKYELDKESGRIRLDRVLRSSVGYPAEYGFIPDTHYSDGDPLDIMVIMRFPTLPGCIVRARPIGVLKMVDTGEHDEKIIAVPADDVYYDSWKNINDVPEPLRNEISEFFSTYKKLEKKKWVKVKGFGGRNEAEAIIKKSRIR